MAASHGRRRSNTSPSTSQAPRTASGPDASGKRWPMRPTRPWGKAGPRSRAPNLSGARPGSTTEGEEPQRFRAAPSPRSSLDVDPLDPHFRRPPHRPRRRRRRAPCSTSIGVDSLDELAAKALPAGILDALDADGVAPGLDGLPAAADRARGAGRAARAGRRQHRRGVDDRAGLLRHAHPAGVAAQHPREPGLVHRLHAVPAGDQPGPARGAAELPDHGRRPDRAGGRQRVDARRGHRRRRGDDADAPRGRAASPNRLVVDADLFPQTVAVLATRAEPLGIEIVTADLRDGPARRRVLRRHRAAARAPAGRVVDWTRPDRRRPTSAARWSPSAPTCWR